MLLCILAAYVMLCTASVCRMPALNSRTKPSKMTKLDGGLHISCITKMDQF